MMNVLYLLCFALDNSGIKQTNDITKEYIKSDGSHGVGYLKELARNWGLWGKKKKNHCACLEPFHINVHLSEDPNRKNVTLTDEAALQFLKKHLGKYSVLIDLLHVDKIMITKTNAHISGAFDLRKIHDDLQKHLSHIKNF